MSRKFIGTRKLIICLVVLSGCLGVAAQKKPADVLRVFEKNIEQGKFAETERPLLSHALANPQDARALELVGRLRQRQGRLEEAKALYSRVLKLDPNFTAAKINYGALLFQTGSPEEAKRIFNEIDETNINDSTARLNFARALTLIDEFQKALAVIGRLPAEVKNNDALPLILVCYLKLGEGHRIDALIPIAKQSGIKRPIIALNAAQVLLDGSRSAQAVDLLKSIVAAAPKNVGALILLARAEIDAKDFTGARRHLDRAVALDPKSAEVFFTRAALENAQGNLTLALELLDKALALSPDSKPILSQIGFTAIQTNNSRKAVAAAETLLRLDPNGPDSLYIHGAASLHAGRLAEAQKSLERFTEMRPRDSRGCLALGLTLAAHRDQIEPARRQLRRCLEIDPANFEAKYQLGLSYKAQGDTARAIQYLEETIALAPNYPMALRDLGTVYLQAGEEAKARDVLIRAVALDPKNADTHFQLSRLYNLTGEPELARSHLETFQKLKTSKGQSPQ